MTGPTCHQVEGLQVRLDHKPQPLHGRDLRFSFRYQGQVMSQESRGNVLVWGYLQSRLPCKHKGAEGGTRSLGFCMGTTWATGRG